MVYKHLILVHVLVDNGNANLVRVLEVTYGCASWNHPATGKAEILRFRTRLQAVRLDLHVYSLNYLLLVIRELFFFLGLEQFISQIGWPEFGFRFC